MPCFPKEGELWYVFFGVAIGKLLATTCQMRWLDIKKSRRENAASLKVNGFTTAKAASAQILYGCVKFSTLPFVWWDCRYIWITNLARGVFWVYVRGTTDPMFLFSNSITTLNRTTPIQIDRCRYWICGTRTNTQNRSAMSSRSSVLFRSSSLQHNIFWRASMFL